MKDYIAEALFVSVSVALFCTGIILFSKNVSQEQSLVSSFSRSQEIHETCMTTFTVPDFSIQR